MKRFATLRPLVGPRQDVGGSFKRMSERLRRSGVRGRLLFRIVGAKPGHWLLDLSRGEFAASKSRAEAADFELLTQQDTWNAIVSGKLSPAEAFLQGKMRVRGDIGLGKRALERLARPGGTLDIC